MRYKKVDYGECKRFYMNDVYRLKLLRDTLNDVGSKEITMRFVIEYLISKIDRIFIGLGAGGEDK